MNKLKAFLTVLISSIFGMWGGQKNKAVRRFGIPFLSLIVGKKKALPFLLLPIILSMGYGENSILYEKLGSDTLVRFVYAVLLSIPFIFYGFIRWVISCVLLVLVFQVHAGSLGHIGWFGDILLEDIFRYSALGILISYNLLRN